MDKQEFESLEKLTDRELFDFVTETDASQRKHVAKHLLEMRRNLELTRAATSSARAARWAAVFAAASAVVAVLALLSARTA